MNLKHILPILLFVLFTTRTAKAQTVYITESGKKYHAKNCSLAKTGKQGMELAEAKKLGYEPCKNCKATEATDPKKDTKKATTGGKK